MSSTGSLFGEDNLTKHHIEDIIRVLKRMSNKVDKGDLDADLLPDHQHATKLLSSLGMSLNGIDDKDARGRILSYFLQRIGQPIEGEALRTIAGISEWPRRIRELRVELGWKIKTQKTGRPDLPAGVYVLESAEQDEPHDRGISDQVRLEVLQRDQSRCQHPGCNWSTADRSEGDPRFTIELHHIHEIADGGSNEVENLISVCNVHHKAIHSRNPATLAWLREWSKT
ncbi:HNH endonuclease signature motif containing protein [Sulfitobacter sp. R18_1]|uniref:HNH endonuclease signature motif containing protein n=1 Tax=Sulfitobacter sp. R18_1 TaxID=2821104 RepID=UPI001ADA67F5|nr:HNH endonuclease signature motif containing protein [Sulfitobacter sp. R18_1]MBO9428782.1 HNH endonuclease [Sulfitobacter sp. R18_1]